MEAEEDEIIVVQSRWTILPTDLSDLILSFLGDIDTLAALNVVCKTPPFFPNEYVYRIFCERVYRAQTRKNILQVKNWKGGLWRSMLVERPRVRTNGFYCVRQLYTRAPCNDRFWEEKRVQSVEVSFFRYFRFFDNGDVLYSLVTLAPLDMEKKIKDFQSEPKRVHKGSYTLRGKSVTVSVNVGYTLMYFDLEVSDSSDPTVDIDAIIGLRRHDWDYVHLPTSIGCGSVAAGKHNVLKMLSHYCLDSGNSATDSFVSFKTPASGDLAFFRCSFW